MKAIVVAALLALSFTTGFTCSKNQPETTTETTTTTETVAPTEAAPAEGTAAPTEAAPAETPAAPAGETHQLSFLGLWPQDIKLQISMRD